MVQDFLGREWNDEAFLKQKKLGKSWRKACILWVKLLPLWIYSQTKKESNDWRTKSKSN
jgi:hypothetical protein